MKNKKIYSAIKMDFNRKVITNDDNEEIPDDVNTFIFTIAQHFIGDPSLTLLILELLSMTLSWIQWPFLIQALTQTAF